MVDAMTYVSSRVVDSTDDSEGLASEDFERFFRATHLRLIRALTLMCGDIHEAEDVAQEAFVKVWERWDRVRSMGRPEGYLYRLALNGHRYRQRRLNRAFRLSRLWGRNSPATTDGAIGALESVHDVMRTLRCVPVRQRSALVLIAFAEFTPAEAAQILGVEAVTVRVLVSQARAALRKEMGANDGP